MTASPHDPESSTPAPVRVLVAEDSPLNQQVALKQLEKLGFPADGVADGEPLITLRPNAVVRNLTIHYPEQRLPEVAPYPWSQIGG